MPVCSLHSNLNDLAGVRIARKNALRSRYLTRRWRCVRCAQITFYSNEKESLLAPGTQLKVISRLVAPHATRVVMY